MNCDTAKELFLAFHDGDLLETDRKALESHLESCASCASEWEAYRITLGEVSGMFALSPSEGFTQRVKQTIGKRSRGRFFSDQRNLGINFAIVSFVLIVLVLLAYLYISSSREIVLIPPSDDTSDIGGNGAPASVDH
jgi:anti-sigma factor RsiW